MKKYSSPNDIKNLHLTKLTNILHDNSHGRYSKQDAIRLREVAKNYVSIDNPSLSLEVKHAILQIELYDEQISEVESLYKQILAEMNTPILVSLVCLTIKLLLLFVVLAISIALNILVNYLLMQALIHQLSNLATFKQGLPKCPNVVQECFDIHLFILLIML